MTDHGPDEWGPHLAEMKRDPEFLALYEAAEERLLAERPGVEFSRATWVLLVLAVVLGLGVLGWAFWYVFTGGRP